ncbi:MAG TPA: Flp pilus assembly protein CpaB [Gemmatimonadales bacterium]|nr:Flp pilus assembly protein CpaB [Gemmatimonadales bacterium]
MWVVLALATASGCLAAFLALRYLSGQRALMAAEPKAASVVVAARDLTVGTIVTAADVRLVPWPLHATPPGYLGASELAVGRGVITPIRTNEPLLEGKLAGKGAGGGLSVTIPEGMRAVSVKVDEVIGVAGFVVPGTRVDVLVTLNQRGRAETITQVLLQNVPTLAAGAFTQPDAQGKPQRVTVITLLVTPDQAETLILAANEGRIQLALRNTLDLATLEPRGARSASLLRVGRDAPVSRSTAAPQRSSAAPDRAVIEAYRGGVRTLIKF